MNLISELVRRSVLRVAMAYIVAAWLIVQVAELLLEAWAYPPAAVQYAVKAAVLGFPVALLFGWFYDITAQGLFRTPPAGEDRAVPRKLQGGDVAALSSLSLGVVAVLAWMAINIGLPPVPELDFPFESIVVMPFESANESEDEERLGAGLANALRTTLSRQERFTVIAGNTIVELIRQGFDARAIQERLGAAYLLSGRVDASFERLGVVAKMVDHAQDVLLQESYDREVSDILRLQREVAEIFATTISISLPADLNSEIVRTVNPLAYQYNQLGREYFHSRISNWNELARDAFQRSIDADPDYAPPYAGLALIDSVNRIGNLPDEEVAEIKVLIDKSLQLDPNQGMGHAAMGFWAWATDGALAAIPHFRKAIELDPVLMNAYAWLAFTLEEIGEFDAKLDVLQSAFARDPLNPIVATALAQNYAAVGDLENANATLERLATLPQPPYVVLPSLQMISHQFGHQEKAIHWAKEGIRVSRDIGIGARYGHLCYEYALTGLFEEAEYWYERQFEGRHMTLTAFANRGFIFKAAGELSQAASTARAYLNSDEVKEISLDGVPGMLAGYFIALDGDFDEAIEIMEASVPLEQVGDILARFDPAIHDLFMTLAWAYQYVGRNDDAIRLLNAVEQPFDDLVINNQAENPIVLERIALMWILRGDLEQALTWFRHAVDNGWRGYYYIAHDPRWAEFLELPEVTELMRFVKADLDRQAERVKEVDATDGFRDFAESLGPPVS